MDFAHFRPRPCGLAHVLGARLVTPGLPQFLAGGFALTRLDLRGLPLLVARAGGSSCRFAQPGTVAAGLAILTRIAILLAVAFEISASLKISAAVARPAPIAAVAALRVQAGLQARFQIGAESGYQIGLSIVEARLAAGLAGRRVVIRFPP